MRGLLPDPDWMTVPALGQVAVSAEAHAECAEDRADRILGIVEEARRQWRAAMEGAR